MEALQGVRQHRAQGPVGMSHSPADSLSLLMNEQTTVNYTMIKRGELPNCRGPL